MTVIFFSMAGDDTCTPAFQFTLWTVLLITVSGQTFSRPKIELDASSMNILTGSTLTLRCRGLKSLQWSTPTDVPKPYQKITNTGEEEELYVSELTVENVLYSYTGYYTCSYVGITRYNIYDNSTRIYVFVNDPNNLLVPAKSNFFTLTPDSEAIIPCRPTDPQVNITLTKGNKTVNLKSGDIIYDNRIGFTILFPNIFYSDNFKCTAQSGNTTNTIDFFLMWSGPSSSTPRPYIDTTDATYVVTEETFTLNCIIAYEAVNSRFSLTWDYKKKRLGENSNVIEGQLIKVNRKTQTSQPFYELMKNLTVINVEPSDADVYSCEASDIDKKSKKKEEIYVHVYEPNTTQILFRTDMNETFPNMIPISTGEVKIVVYIRAHPKPIKISWWKNNEKELKNNTKYQMEISNNISSILIKSLTLNDTANYTLSVQTNRAERNITFPIWITSKPAIDIIRYKPIMYIPYNKTFKLECKGMALPLANTKWEWSPCDYLGCEKNYGPFASYNKEVVDFTRFGTCNFVSSLTMSARTSAYYKCKSENDLGTTEIETLLVITDISDGMYGFSIGKDTRLKFYEKDRMLLSCNASKFNYTSDFTWIKISKTDQQIILNDSNHYIAKKETDFSFGSELIIPSLRLQDQGLYICETKNLMDNTAVQRKITVYVDEIKPPFTLETNMNGSVYNIQNEQPIEFICNISGRPDPKIEWRRNNKTIDQASGTQYLFKNEGKVLNIPRVVEGDEGTYFCIAENHGGKLSLNATLTVIEPLPPAKISSTVKIVIAVVVLIVLIALGTLSAIVGRKCYIDRKERMEIYQLEKALFEKGAMERYNPELPFEEQIEFLPYDQQWEFPREKLKLGRTIGQGAFGRVVKAEAQGIIEGEASTTVAVKMLKENANIEQRKALMQELKIMIHLGRHVNILNLLGACVQNSRKGELLAIMEFCRYGNLRNFLLRHRQSFVNQVNSETGKIDKNLINYRISTVPNSPTRTSGASTIATTTATTGTDGYLIPLSPGVTSNNGASFIPSELIHSENSADSSGAGEDSTGFGRLSISTKHTGSSSPLSTSDLVCFGYQIACGMEYLASRKLVHRDLAARNILLADNYIIKICDFGLAKDCYKKTYYRKKGDGPLPIKWMATESIKDKVFSVESDIWSYGIVLWELFSLGSNPYPGFEVNENFYKKLLSGYRMEKPEYATDDIYNIMYDCWDKEPQDRPKFSEIVERIGNYLDSASRQHLMELNDNYLRLYKLTTGKPDYVNMIYDSNSDLKGNYVNIIPSSDMRKDYDSGYVNSSAVEEDSDPSYLQMRGSNVPNSRSYRSEDGESCELVSMLPRTSTELNDIAVQPKEKDLPSEFYSTNDKQSNRFSEKIKGLANKSSLPPTYSTVIMENESTA